jgi:hypothetical protein
VREKFVKFFLRKEKTAFIGLVAFVAGDEGPQRFIFFIAHTLMTAPA